MQVEHLYSERVGQEKENGIVERIERRQIKNEESIVFYCIQDI